MLRALTELTARFTSAHVVVLCYHAIRSRERFASQMAVLSERGYSVLTLPQFTEWLNGSARLAHRASLLTFDHCYAEQLEHAVPVLDALRLPGTFFPVSGGLSSARPTAAAQWRHTLLELTKAGHTIGCHTHRHAVLTSLSTSDIRQEVLASKRALEDALGQRVSAFCYPYGAHDARVREVVQEIGFDVAFTVDLGGVTFGDDPYRLKRAPVMGEPGSVEFGVYLSGTFLVAGAVLLSWKVRERLLDRNAFGSGRDR